MVTKRTDVDAGTGHTGAKIKVSLTGVPETLLVTLLARMRDANEPKPVLGDDWAKGVIDRIDYDFSKLAPGSDGNMLQHLICHRARQLDLWIKEFLATHRETGATVLQLACGLDSRAFRILRDIGPEDALRVQWIEVDLPEVIALRHQVFPAEMLAGNDGVPAGAEYRVVAADVTGDGWLDTIPADRPIVVVAEGLLFYLEEKDGRRLVERLVERFSEGRQGKGGQLIFDNMSGFAVWSSQLFGWAVHASIRKTGAVFRWGIGDPAVLEKWYTGLRLLNYLPFSAMPLDGLPLTDRIKLLFASYTPYIRTFVGLVRCEL